MTWSHSKSNFHVNLSFIRTEFIVIVIVSGFRLKFCCRKLSHINIFREAYKLSTKNYQKIKNTKTIVELNTSVQKYSEFQTRRGKKISIKKILVAPSVEILISLYKLMLYFPSFISKFMGVKTIEWDRYKKLCMYLLLYTAETNFSLQLYFSRCINC